MKRLLEFQENIWLLSVLLIYEMYLYVWISVLIKYVVKYMKTSKITIAYY